MLHLDVPVCLGAAGTLSVIISASPSGEKGSIFRLFSTDVYEMVV